MSLYYSPNEIKIFAKENNIISLIRAYREMSGNGLKKSRQIIEECSTEIDHNKFIKAILEVFQPYFKDPTQSIRNAINYVLDNYLILGFETPKDAVNAIMKNF